MGIPRFFSWLIKNYKNIPIKNSKFAIFLEKIEPNTVVSLNFDLNAIIHPIANILMQDGNYDPNTIKGCVEKYILELTKYIQPTKEIFIAIDGIAPSAKMIQQRMRRYKNKMYGNFPSNQISPGTQFMENLVEFLKGSLKQSADLYQASIAISSDRLPGEGEHKIFERIKEEDRKTMINSADSDLVVISIARGDNVILARDRFSDPSLQEKSILFDDLVKEYAREFAQRGYTPLNSEFQNEQWRRLFDEQFYFIDTRNLANKIRTNKDDFLGITYFIGNDFIPPIPELSVTNPGRSYNFIKKNQIIGRLARKYEQGKKKYDANWNTYSKSWKIFEDGSLRRENFDVKKLKSIQAFYNIYENRQEIYPKHKSYATGIVRRFVMYKEGNYWKKEENSHSSLDLTMKILNQNKSVVNLIQDNLVNPIALLKLLRLISMDMNKYMISHELQYEYMLSKEDSYPNELILDSISYKLKSNANNIPVGINSLLFSELNYYKHLAIANAEYSRPEIPKRSVKEMCHHWFIMVNWITRYYLDGHQRVNKEIYYPFTISPGVSDLISYLEEKISPRISYNLPNVCGEIGYDFEMNAVMTTYNKEKVIMFVGFDMFPSFFRVTKGIPERLDDFEPNPNENWSKDKIKIKCKWYFKNINEIVQKISTKTRYPTMFEMLFMIFPPISILEIFPESQEIMIEIIDNLSDMFPQKVGQIQSGKYFESQIVEKVSMMGLDRIRDVLKKFEYNEEEKNKLVQLFFLSKKNFNRRKKLIEIKFSR